MTACAAQHLQPNKMVDVAMLGPMESFGEESMLGSKATQALCSGPPGCSGAASGCARLQAIFTVVAKTALVHFAIAKSTLLAAESEQG